MESRITALHGQAARGFGSLGKTDGFVCPTCKTQNAGRVEDGCVNCGTGTQAEREKAIEAARVAGGEIPIQQLGTAIMDETFDDGTTLTVDLLALTPRARRTLANALAFYAEGSTPVNANAELPRQYTLSWARAILAAIPEEK